MTFAVQVEGLRWRYPSFTGQENPWVLQGVDLCVRPGEFLGLTGPSGAGKTTLCRLILGVLPHGVKIPFRQINRHIGGSVRVLGEWVTQVDAAANIVDGVALGKLGGQGVLSPRVGMVMQDPENQFLTMSVLHELAFGLALRGLEQAEILRRAQEALEKVGLGHLWRDAEHIHPADLSGGQKQRVAIASFLALRPEVLILDEPTSDLDPLGKHEVIETIRQLRAVHGVTVLLVEHEAEILSEFCDRIALLNEGQIVTVSEPQAFYAQADVLDAHGVASFEGSRIAWHLGISERGRSLASLDELASVLSQWPAPGQVPLAAPPPVEPVIEVEDLHYTYPDGTVALTGANLMVRRGEMLALLGSNGSGKTTLAKILAGLYAPGEGRAAVLGQSLASRGVRRDLPRYIGYVFQNPDHQLFTRRVYDEVAYGLDNLGLRHGERDATIRRTLETVGLLGVLNEDPLFLGKGQRQRLAVAAVLAMGPEILIVDEPTTGQDHRMVLGIMSLLEQLRSQNKTVLIITHDMQLVAEHCSRAVVLLDGQTAFDGDPRQLFAEQGLLARTHLRAPQAIRLSLAMRQRWPDYPLLLNVAEWAAAYAIPRVRPGGACAGKDDERGRSPAGG